VAEQEDSVGVSDRQVWPMIEEELLADEVSECPIASGAFLETGKNLTC
jgi:hypothetical protein